MNSNADTVADDGVCTLREAITNANGDSQLYATAGECAAGVGSDTIAFAADYTITLVGSQLPAVTTTIIINGNGAANTIVQANANPNTATYRVFQVSGNLTLDKLTVQNGRCNGSCEVTISAAVFIVTMVP
ncbi:MAG: CSLREA domain-containing protein [Anaerolineales bacterium]|nr:CSLREA domain-containing protein [Anaerolineales bacterium]